MTNSTLINSKTIIKMWNPIEFNSKSNRYTLTSSRSGFIIIHLMRSMPIRPWSWSRKWPCSIHLWVRHKSSKRSSNWWQWQCKLDLFRIKETRKPNMEVPASRIIPAPLWRRAILRHRHQPKQQRLAQVITRAWRWLEQVYRHRWRSLIKQSSNWSSTIRTQPSSQ